MLWFNISRLHLPYFLLRVYNELWSQFHVLGVFLRYALHFLSLISYTKNNSQTTWPSIQIHNNFRTCEKGGNPSTNPTVSGLGFIPKEVRAIVLGCLIHNTPDQRISEYNIYFMIEYTKVVSNLLASACLQRALVTQFHELRVFFRYALHVASLISYTKKNSQTTWPSIQIHNNIPSTQNV
jgi:thiamine transporter ThiT